jgi:hypothetical protein
LGEGPLDLIDDDYVGCCSHGLQFQAELLLHRSEEAGRRAGLLLGGSGARSAGRAGYRRACELPFIEQESVA